MVSIVKWSIVVWLSVISAASNGNLEILKKDQVRVCVRWKWTGDVFNRTVYCVEWAIKYCSNRLYPEICKGGG